MQDPLASWAAIISAIATFIVAILTLINILIAKGSLKLMQKKENRWLPLLELYHIDSFVKRFLEQNIRLYLVKVRISNISDSDNSTKEISLIIRFHRNQDISSNIAIQNLSENINYFAQLVDKNNNDILEIPSHIKAHTVKTGWIIFKVGDEILRDAIIELYEIKLVDTHNIESSLRFTIFRQESDEERLLA